MITKTVYKRLCRVCGVVQGWCAGSEATPCVACAGCAGYSLTCARVGKIIMHSLNVIISRVYTPLHTLHALHRPRLTRVTFVRGANLTMHTLHARALFNLNH